MNSPLHGRCWRLPVLWSLGLSLALLLSVVSEAQTSVTQPLPPPGQISGHVYRSDTGEPIPKAQVELTAADETTASALGDERIARTAADGSFLFSDLPPGRYQMESWRNGFAQFSWQQGEQEIESRRAQKSLTLNTGQKVDNVVLHLFPAGVIAGQVSDEDHDPVAGLQVYALAVSFERGGWRQVNAAGRATTDDLGNFRIANLPPGPYYLKAGGLIGREKQDVGLKQDPAGGTQYRETYFPGTPLLAEAQVLPLSPEGVANIQLTVVPVKTYAISGKVLPQPGSPLGRVDQVECKPRASDGYTFGTGENTSPIAPDGSFRIPRMPPGEYTLSAVAIRNGVETESGFASVRVVDTDVHATVELGQAARVRGTVESPPGFPVAGSQITLETFGPGFFLLHQGMVDTKGHFNITNIPPGDFTFALSGKDGESSAYIKNALCNGSDYAAVVFALTVNATLDCNVTIADDTGSIRGRILDGDKPLSRMLAVLIPEPRELRQVYRYMLTSKTDSAGSYKIVGVVPGNYLLFAVPPSRDRSYFALDFVDKHRDGAVEITVSPSSAQAIDLKLSKTE